MSTPVALIIGAGANIGQSAARAFAAKGYKVAVTSRSLKAEPASPDQLQIVSDLADPESMAKTFAEVEAKLGVPHVVVYNAAAASFTDGKTPFEPSVATFTKSLTINTISLYAAVQQAVAAFERLPESASRTFLYTGNNTNVVPLPAITDLTVGKAASAYVLQIAGMAYADKGFKFYYVDQRTDDGSPMNRSISGKAHAEHFVKLSEGKTQETWWQTFVDGIGYKKF